ncbi:MAG TPA: WXG100 family type VII secretion target [Pseudonocardiaceae bacterium]|jgi:WXG100 family type VII secretion target|nr:WXG100 family type VII secretion target [Pseudonocardiaceae bacterium]
MAGYQTGAPELIQAGKQMESANEQLQANLKNVMSEVEGVAGAWSGQAHSAFVQLMDSFNTDAQKLNENLNKIAEAIAGSAQAYQRQEEESAQSVSSIASALKGM